MSIARAVPDVEKKVLVASLLFSGAMLALLAYAAVRLGISVPGCVTNVKPFTKGELIQMAPGRYEAQDRVKDLRDFRERFALPADWLVVRSADPGATRAFLDGLDFHFMRSGAGFDHPNETFVFSPMGAWAATLTGAAFPAAELEAARDRALAADDPSAFRTARAWLVRPEAWILLACAGLALSLIAIALVRKTPPVTSTRD